MRGGGANYKRYLPMRKSVLKRGEANINKFTNAKQVVQTFQDLLDIGVDCVTLGQYLQPTKKHMKVDTYVTPEKFAYWQKVGEEMGFKYVASGPFVRSSYRAGEFYIKHLLQQKGIVEDKPVQLDGEKN